MRSLQNGGLFLLNHTLPGNLSAWTDALPSSGHPGSLPLFPGFLSYVPNAALYRKGLLEPLPTFLAWLTEAHNPKNGSWNEEKPFVLNIVAV